MIKAAKLAVLGVLVAVFAVLGSGAAQAYPDPVVKIEVGDARFVGGLPLDFTATSSVECTSWTVTFNGETKTGPAGTSFSGTFSTPKVTRVTPKSITATCTYESTGATAAAVASDTATVTLLPLGGEVADNNDALEPINNNAGTNGSGILPDTGGSNLWILIVGGVLVLAGGGAVVASRHRS